MPASMSANNKGLANVPQPTRRPPRTNHCARLLNPRRHSTLPCTRICTHAHGRYRLEHHRDDRTLMTEAHRTPEYFRNSRTVRRITNARLKRGDQVQCIGCGQPIQPEQQYDIGHIRDSYRGGNNTLENLGPQHRKENRSAGGRAGALATNQASRKAKRLPTW